MDYSVALDSVPASGIPMDGAMARTWMAAAEEHGIPTAFVIRDGKIAWIGHPMSMDQPLDQDHGRRLGPDGQGARAARRQDQGEEDMGRPEKVYTPLRQRDYKGTLAAIEEVAASDPDLSDAFDMVKFSCLGMLGEIDAAVAVGTKLVERYKEDSANLNAFAWGVVNPDAKPEPDTRLARLGLDAARRAVELTKGEDMAVLDTLACALYRTGDVDGAIATEEKALKRLEAETKDQSHPYFKEFNGRLERFREAAKKKADRP